MDPERWQRIGELFHRALELGADGRARFLDDACHGDPALRAEVESILAHHENSAPPVVPTPPAEEAPARGDLAAPELLAGRQLGPYRITRMLGQGGMGVVHLAEDTRLGRFVAIKALPPQFTRDERRRRRLRREARAAASLTHPGIATVYALEEFDGTLCIVSEYVPGETLRQEAGRRTAAAGRPARHRDRDRPRPRRRARGQRPAPRPEAGKRGPRSRSPAPSPPRTRATSCTAT